LLFYPSAFEVEQLLLLDFFVLSLNYLPFMLDYDTLAICAAHLIPHMIALFYFAHLGPCQHQFDATPA